jgi:hypothetical protein
MKEINWGDCFHQPGVMKRPYDECNCGKFAPLPIDETTRANAAEGKLRRLAHLWGDAYCGPIAANWGIFEREMNAIEEQYGTKKDE